MPGLHAIVTVLSVYIVGVNWFVERMEVPMRVTRLLLASIPIAGLAACASAPAPVAVTAPPPAPIAVSCATDTLTDHPCLDDARKACPSPSVDTIRLVLAKQVPVEAQPTPKVIYEYEARYRCPGQRVASTP
jgi:hypothetical protein